MLSVLGEQYTAQLRGAYQGRLPGGANLVTFWFEKARTEVERGTARYVGLVATRAIRGHHNRIVLDRIREIASFFEAWSDEPWVVEGAAVRVSLVCFAPQKLLIPHLNGKPVLEIYSDLTGRDAERGTDLGIAKVLCENLGISFQGPVKIGPFDIPGPLARDFLQRPVNPNGRYNLDVVKPWANGMDVTRRPSDHWIIDFAEMREDEASLYEAPYQHVLLHVKPVRDHNRRSTRREKWWQHGETVPGLRTKLQKISRYILTPRVSKYRLFVWRSTTIMPDSRLVAVARDDDFVFGLLHSRAHEVWSLRLGGWHGVGDDPQYTPSLGFERFPFPDGLTPDVPAADCARDSRAQAIAAAARRLNELREAWLNPPDLVRRVPEVVPAYPERLVPVDEAAAALLKKRTLTNLYNDRPAWLNHAHRELDCAVAAAYGWEREVSDDEVLRRLLALNLEQAERRVRSG